MFITSAKSKPLLVFNGYSFYLDKNSGPKRSWRCSSFISQKCKVRIHTFQDEIIRVYLGEHNHSPNLFLN